MENLKLYLTGKNLIAAALLLIMVLGIPLAVNLVRQQQLLRSRASNTNVIFTGPNVQILNNKEVAVDKTIQVRVNAGVLAGTPTPTGVRDLDLGAVITSVGGNTNVSSAINVVATSDVDIVFTAGADVTHANLWIGCESFKNGGCAPDGDTTGVTYRATFSGRTGTVKWPKEIKRGTTPIQVGVHTYRCTNTPINTAPAVGAVCEGSNERPLPSVQINITGVATPTPTPGSSIDITNRNPSLNVYWVSDSPITNAGSPPTNHKQTDGSISPFNTNQDVYFYFNKNNDVTHVNLKVDGEEAGGTPKNQATFTIDQPCPTSGCFIKWPKEYKHTAGTHNVKVKPYVCPDATTQGCKALNDGQEFNIKINAVSSSNGLMSWLPKIDLINTVFAAHKPGHPAQCSDPNDTDFFGCYDLVGQCPDRSTPPGGGCYPNHYVSDCLKNCPSGAAPTATPTPTPITVATATPTPITSPTFTPTPTPTPGAGTITPIPSGVTITKYKVTDQSAGADKNDTIWNGVADHDYSATGTNQTDFTFSAKPCSATNCDQYPREDRIVYVLFIGTNSDGSPYKNIVSASILLAVKPKIISVICQSSPTGAGTQIIINGQHFGTEAGTVQYSDQPANTSIVWGNNQITTNSSLPLVTNKDIVVTTPEGPDASVKAQCSDPSKYKLDFQATLTCRSVEKPLREASVEIRDLSGLGIGTTASTKNATSVYKNAKEGFDEQGHPQALTGLEKLEEGRSYELIIKATGTLQKVVKFIAVRGTNVLDAISLPLGDIAPAPNGDNQVNALDRSELNQEWSAAKDVAKRADFNLDSRVNSFDNACLNSNYGISGDNP